MSRRPKSHAPKRRPFRAPSRVTLSDEWRAWIVENAARGTPPDELVQALVEADIPQRLASREVKTILASPAFPGCKKLHEKAERLELGLRLLRSLAAHTSHLDEIERRETITAEELFDRYYSAACPVVLTQLLRDWPALTKWTPEYFAERFGNVEIEAVTKRDENPHCDREIDRHRQKMTMAEYCGLVRSHGPTNDLYLVSGNRAFERPELAELLSDLTPPSDIFDVPVRPGYASLWFGPAGTRTPLHHDTSNILVCQIYGRKRITLVAPLSASILQSAEGFYAGRDWKDLLASEEDPLRARTVELSAGEALFLPAGYWHEVEALEPSIHVSMLGFRRPNSAGWYRPGFISA
jgi:hypothetical protein